MREVAQYTAVHPDFTECKMRWLRGVPDDLPHERGMRGLRWTMAEGAAYWLPSSLLDDPEDFLLNNHPQKLLKESSVRTALIIPGPKGDLFLKRYKIRDFTDGLKYLVFPSKARKEWVMARRALSKGIPTPLPLAMAERRRARFLKEAFLITQTISPSSPLIELIPEKGHEDLLLNTARLLRGAHDAGLFHQDLHAGNILVETQMRNVYIIDLHRSKFVRRVSRQQRLWNLAQFFYSLKGLISEEEKKAFLQRYNEQGNAFGEGPDAGVQEEDWSSDSTDAI
jgi:tRNA A-37 threonylcarbamoyl transferase component Bud32